MKEVKEFKVGDNVKIVKGVHYDGNFSRAFYVGDEFVIYSFDNQGDARDSRGRWCVLQCLELLSPPLHERRLWDGKESLEVGMWASSGTHEEECQIKLITDKEIAYVDSDGDIMTDRIGWLSPINQRIKKENLIDSYFDKLFGIGNEQSYKTLLSKFYDEVIKQG